MKKSIYRTPETVRKQMERLCTLIAVALKLRNRYEADYIRQLDQWRPAYEDFPHTYGSKMYERYSSKYRSLSNELKTMQENEIKKIMA